jgi:LysM repeat protein
MKNINTTVNLSYPTKFFDSFFKKNAKEGRLDALRKPFSLPLCVWVLMPAFGLFAVLFFRVENLKAEKKLTLHPQPSPTLVHFADSIGLERYNGKLYIRHRVRAGEDILSIARRYYTDVNTLISLNPFARNPLQQGQIVRIPYNHKEAPTSIRNYTVRNEDTLYKIALKFGTTPKAIKELNQMTTNEIRVGQDLLIPINENAETTRSLAGSGEAGGQAQNQQGNEITYQYYTVESGDNLIKIANQYKTTVAQLKEWNQLTSDKIRIGQKLIVGKSEVYTPLTTSSKISSNKQIRSESGVCSLIDSDGTRFLGLHRHLPVGTMVRVFNENTGRSVEVEIIGKIPNISANENIIIKITKAACYQLGTKAKEFPVVLTWEAK